MLEPRGRAAISRLLVIGRPPPECPYVPRAGPQEVLTVALVDVSVLAKDVQTADRSCAGADAIFESASDSHGEAKK